MKQAIILRRVKSLSSFCTGKNHYYPTLNKNNPTVPNYNNLIPPISKPDSSATQDTILDGTQDGELSQVEDVSNEELKKRIERYFQGDEDAISDIFEAILRRKIAGKHGEESDDEILKEIRQENPLNTAANKEVDEVDSDFDDTDDDEILKEIRPENPQKVATDAK